jgi:antitoxin MazE
MQISKWGNSLAVRLPSSLVRRLKLQVGDEVELVPASSADERVTFAVETRRSRRDLVNDLCTFAGRLPREFTFDRDEAYRPIERGPIERG